MDLSCVVQPAEILIAYKANPNATGDHGIRPIHRSAACRVSLANPNLAYAMKLTGCVLRAAMAGHDEVVRLLLRSGADALAVDEYVKSIQAHCVQLDAQLTLNDVVQIHKRRGHPSCSERRSFRGIDLMVA